MVTEATRAILFHFFPKSLAFFHLSLIYTKEVDLGGNLRQQAAEMGSGVPRA